MKSHLMLILVVNMYIFMVLSLPVKQLFNNIKDITKLNYQTQSLIQSQDLTSNESKQTLLFNKIHNQNKVTTQYIVEIKEISNNMMSSCNNSMECYELSIINELDHNNRLKPLLANTILTMMSTSKYIIQDIEDYIRISNHNSYWNHFKCGLGATATTLGIGLIGIELFFPLVLEGVLIGAAGLSYAVTALAGGTLVHSHCQDPISVLQNIAIGLTIALSAFLIYDSIDFNMLSSYLTSEYIQDIIAFIQTIVSL